MFKAFLRTDGIVTVSGGDVAWEYQRKHFLRYCTKLFAYSLKKMPDSLLLSEIPPKGRTILCEPYDFVGVPIENISDQEFQQCREILLSIVKREQKTQSHLAV